VLPCLPQTGQWQSGQGPGFRVVRFVAARDSGPIPLFLAPFGVAVTVSGLFYLVVYCIRFSPGGDAFAVCL